MAHRLPLLKTRTDHVLLVLMLMLVLVLLLLVLLLLLLMVMVSRRDGLRTI